jgi:hypothetical protein
MQLQLSLEKVFKNGGRGTEAVYYKQWTQKCAEKFHYTATYGYNFCQSIFFCLTSDF